MADLAPFRLQGEEVYSDIKTQTPKSVPDADSEVLARYRAHMDRMFRGTRLPALFYKGSTIPARNLGQPVV